MVARVTTIDSSSTLLIEVRCQVAGQNVTAIAMIDSGSSINIINPKFVNQVRIPWSQKKRTYKMRTYEGQVASYDGGRSQRESTLLITVEDDPREETFDILPIGLRYDIILGLL